MTSRSNGVTVTVDPARVGAYMRSPQGPLFRRMSEDGELVKREAQRLVGVHDPQGSPLPRSRRPGTLRDSIVKRVVDRGGELVVQVGSEDPIALWHHEGTQPHVIVPRRARRLVFWSARSQRVIYAKRVFHPGTRPNRYLLNAVRVLRSRY